MTEYIDIPPNTAGGKEGGREPATGSAAHYISTYIYIDIHN